MELDWSFMGATVFLMYWLVLLCICMFLCTFISNVWKSCHQSRLNRGPIYKESYARLMTAQHLCRTYAELVNCERLTKNHKLNLRKIYAKLTQNLGKTYDHINAVITQS